MANKEQLKAEISNIVIFVELTDGTVRQVIATPSLKLMALKFMENHGEEQSIFVGDKEAVTFDQLKNKEI